MLFQRKDLSALDHYVMLAVRNLHPDAYGVSISDEIKRMSGWDYAPGSIYAALERLENRGYLDRRLGEATRERGGRAKVYFVITEKGHYGARSCLTGG